MSNSNDPASVRQRAPVPVSECALAQAVEEIGDRWSLLILREAFFGVKRYDDIRRDLGTPRSVLTDRLTKLVARGLLEKQPYQEAGDRKRYGYALTEKGRDLAISLIAITHWSEAHVLKRPGPIAFVEAASGKALRLALVDDDGRIIDVKEAATKLRGA